MPLNNKIRALFIAMSAAVTAAAMPGAAGAATVSDRTVTLDGVSSSALVVTDAAAQINGFKVTVDGPWVTVEDTRNPLSETSASCWNYNPSVVVCNTATSVQVDVRAGSGNDVVNLVNLTPSGPRSLAVYGGPGVDALYGSAGIDWLVGEADNDYLVGGAGKDSLIGGAGNDAFHAMDGEVDQLSGGDGCDRADLDDADKRNSIENGTTHTLGWVSC